MWLSGDPESSSWPLSCVVVASSSLACVVVDEPAGALAVEVVADASFAAVSSPPPPQAASAAQAAGAARAIARRARTVDIQDSSRGGRRPAVVLGPPNRPRLGDPNMNTRGMPTAAKSARARPGAVW